MDARKFFLGLGTGMIAATLIIGAGGEWLADQAAGSQQTVQAPPSSDWRAEAEQAGLVVLKKEEYQQQLTSAEEKGAQQQAAQQKEAQAQQGASDSVFVYIQPGMGTTDVAILLQAAGVISDGNGFIASRGEWSNPIRSGAYELKKNSNPKDVLKAIATPPSN
ncbi:hypothetical protein [Tumebacillus lipolyticus]|uniref:Endolytic transglycosylase MltG n=1 Tax=Tumebacillus lipolyticus TaxID=1280370 RepID=A0ABW5A107_9BACL